jgi:hypothetical protein
VDVVGFLSRVPFTTGEILSSFLRNVQLGLPLPGSHPKTRINHIFYLN